MIALATLVLTATLQAGGPPLLGPNGRPLHIVDVDVSGPARQVLAVEQLGQIVDVTVLDLDAAGRLARTGRIPASLAIHEAAAIHGDRMIVLDEGHLPRVFERGPTGWTAGADLGLERQLGTFGNFLFQADIDGALAVVAHPNELSITVHDIATSGQPTLVATLPHDPARGVGSIAIEGGIVVVVDHVTYLPPAGGWGLRDMAVRVYERTSTGWPLAYVLRDPGGNDWSDGGLLHVDIDADRIVVGKADGHAADRCGRVYVYERGPSGQFVFDAEIRSSAPCEISPDRGTGFGAIARLIGDELAVVHGFDAVGERFEHTAAGWVARERVITAGSLAGYWPGGGRLIGFSDYGLQVFDTTGGTGLYNASCPTPLAGPLWFLTPAPRSLPLSTARTMTWYAPPVPASQAHLMVVGLLPTHRPLGQQAVLCVGGALQVSAMSLTTGSLGVIATYDFDPVQLGISAGTTVYMQCWRSVAGVSGGLTSNAVSVTVGP